MTRRVVTWVAAVLAAVALVVALAVGYADRTLLDSRGFADRAAAATRAAPVRAAISRHVAAAAIGARPDLVAVRPLLESAASAVVGSEAFRTLLRGAAGDLHRSAFDRRANTVTLRAGDAGILLAEALERLRPEFAARLPDRLDVRLATASGWDLQVAERAQRVRRGGLIALVASLLLGAAAFVLAGSPRTAVLRLGTALAAVAAPLALVVALASHVAVGASPDAAAIRSVAGTWLYPLAGWLAAAAACGAVVALAAASVVRPLPGARALLVPLARHPALRAPVLIGAGAVAVLAPGAAVRIAGALAVAAGVNELLRLAAVPEPPRRLSRPSVPRGARLAAVAAGVSVVALGAAGIAGGHIDIAPRTGACNGAAALCDRPLNEVAFVGTHNSMAADGEPGWLFGAQDAGIPSQLTAGVRSLLIDTHYGFATPRGVATDLSGESISRAKVTEHLSDAFVDTAERLRERIGFNGDTPREVFLCHAFCEVGATRAVDALRDVHRFLVTHPEEVLILSIEDDTDAADTVATIRDSGLGDEVYHGPAKPPWPTLGEMIERDERVLVLFENHARGAPAWVHDQKAAMQETPFHFATAAELAAPSSCDPNRGGTAGSLLLVNHWVDTSPAPRTTIAREVNAGPFLSERLNRCRERRGLLPTVVAVDFYEQGDVFRTVAKLNGLIPPG